MSADYYMDENVLAIDHTLIRLHYIRSRKESYTVPSSFNGYNVTVAGSGSLELSLAFEPEICFDQGYIELKEKCLGFSFNTRRIIIPETVQKMPDNLFYQKILKSMIQFPDLLIDRAMNPASFHEMLQSSISIGKNKLMIPTFLLSRKDMDPVRCLLANNAKPAGEINKSMRILLSGVKGSYSGTIFDTRPCFDFVGGKNETEEYSVVMQMIRDDDLGWHDPETELKCDQIIRIKHRTNYKEVGFVICDQVPDSPGEDGMFHIRFKMMSDFLFFPSLRHIRYKGSDWWIYCRNTLSNNDNYLYHREDVGVFDRNGLVTDKKISEDVYAKYRLISLL